MKKKYYLNDTKETIAFLKDLREFASKPELKDIAYLVLDKKAINDTYQAFVDGVIIELGKREQLAAQCYKALSGELLQNEKILFERSLKTPVKDSDNPLSKLLQYFDSKEILQMVNAISAYQQALIETPTHIENKQALSSAISDLDTLAHMIEKHSARLHCLPLKTNLADDAITDLYTNIENMRTHLMKSKYRS